MKKPGYALATVLVLLAVCLFGVGVLISISNLESKVSRSQQEGIQAYYVAEAGLADVVWRLNTVASLKTSFSNGNLNTTYTAANQPGSGQSFTVKAVSSTPSHAEVEITGSSNNGDFTAKRVLKAQLFSGAQTNSAANLAIMSGERVIVSNGSGNLNINGGDLYGGSNIVFNNAKVALSSGAIKSPGTYTSSNSTVNAAGGIKASNYQPAAAEQSIPGMDFGYYASHNSVSYTSNQFKSLVQNAPGNTLNLPGPVTYISSGINMAGWAKNVTINVTGMLIFNGNFTVNHSAVTNFKVNITDPGNGKAGLFSSGSINNGNGEWNVQGVMYAAGDMQFVNARNINLNGGLIAGGNITISTGLNMNVQYNQTRSQAVFGGGSGSTVVQVDHWEEEY